MVNWRERFSVLTIYVAWCSGFKWVVLANKIGRISCQSNHVGRMRITYDDGSYSLPLFDCEILAITRKRVQYVRLRLKEERNG